MVDEAVGPGRTAVLHAQGHLSRSQGPRNIVDYHTQSVAILLRRFLLKAGGALLAELLDGGCGEHSQSSGVFSRNRAAHSQKVPHRCLSRAVLVECPAPLPAVDGVLHLSAELPCGRPLLVEGLHVLQRSICGGEVIRAFSQSERRVHELHHVLYVELQS